MLKYVPSSEFFDDNEDLLREYSRQDIWNMVGFDPFILSIKQAIRLHSDWFGTLQSFEFLCKALAAAEKETYVKLGKAEKRPSEIVEEYMPRPDETSGQPMVWYPDGTDEGAIDPVRV